MMSAWPILVPAVAAAGAGIAAWAAMYPGAQLYGPTVRHTAREGTVALTFDDGPNPRMTPQLLDLLDQHKVRATFFLIGCFVRECPNLVREIAARGHTVANHTDTHPNLAWLSAAAIAEQLRRCQESIASALGISAESGADRLRWMRPPYGFRGPQLNRVVRRQGIQGVVMWSVICYDWKPQPPSRLIHRLERVRGGDIVVLHDGDHRMIGGDRRHVLGALEYWLPRWRERGLDFVTMDRAASDAF